jgi:hypothetical protein
MQGKDVTLQQADKDIQRAVVTMLHLKLRSGSTPIELKRFVAACVSHAISSHKPSKQGQMIWLYQIARVLRTWHLETRYLTESGQPRPLMLSGSNGLRSLIRSNFPQQRVNLVLETMRRNGLIRRRKTGYWIPTSRYARTPRPTVELLSHFAEGVSRFAETVGKNTATRRKGDLLLERAAQVSDLPRKDAKEFRKFVQAQGMAFLTAVDDWLESRSHAKPRRRDDVCNAGVFTFAFIDDLNAKNKTKSVLF